VDGITRTRDTPLGRTSRKLLATLPPSLAHGSRSILGMYAHHEAICAYAIPPTLSYPKLSSPMVVRRLFCQCLQCDVHLCIIIFLLTNLSCMVSFHHYPQTYLKLTRGQGYIYIRIKMYQSIGTIYRLHSHE
jgi:hypothetical protein